MSRRARIILGIVAAGAALGPAPGLAQDEPAVAQRAAAGARVFGDRGCAGCHAVDGVGGGTGPDLARVREAPTLAGIGAALWNHLPQMAARMRARGTPAPRLDPWDAGDLIAFLFAIRYYTPAADPGTGAALFSGKGCVRCHQVRGAGGVVGPPLDGVGGATPIELTAALWNHAPAMAREMRARNLRRPSLSGPDLGHLRAYLGDTAAGGITQRVMHVLPGREAVGRTLFRDRRCAVCHGPDGRGGPFGPDLAAARRRDLAEFAAAMWNKAPRMAAAAGRARIELPRLEPAEMADLVAYLASLQYLGEEGSAERGAARVTSSGCRRCHSPAGPAPDLSGARGVDTPGGVLAALWNHVALPESALARRWPRLRARDVSDLTAYLARGGGGR
jgi:mono/diheme cytochrome c family protein